MVNIVFPKHIRTAATRLGDRELLTARDEDAAVLGFATRAGNEPQLVDRAHASLLDLDGADDDELDLLLGDQAELRVDAESGGLEQRL